MPEKKTNGEISSRRQVSDSAAVSAWLRYQLTRSPVNSVCAARPGRGASTRGGTSRSRAAHSRDRSTTRSEVAVRFCAASSLTKAFSRASAPLLDLRPGEAAGQCLLQVPHQGPHRHAVEDDVVVAEEDGHAGLVDAADDGEPVRGAVGQVELGPADPPLCRADRLLEVAPPGRDPFEREVLRTEGAG